MSNSSQVGDGDHAVDLDPLVLELAKVLPKGYTFTAHHLSTTPTPTDPLCHPPAYNAVSSSISGDVGVKSKERRPSKPLKTYCEKHFLTISIGAGEEGETRHDKQVLVLGLEIYIYTTSFSTIIFVSKADSTGYLHLLHLPKGTPSPIREVTACFLSFLIANRRRPTKQLVVNLFARAQSQYLFPGSVKNSGKHVLDDRGLVKWWCRVLNLLLEGDKYLETKSLWDAVHGYLVIPGLDNYETRAFLPKTGEAATNWTLGHPLETISPYTRDEGTFGRNIHPRSLIPTFPDDPKARFVQELEESTSAKARLLSGWKTPKNLDQFWEMMAFRQECSSGRMTGFIWVVFEPRIAPKPDSIAATSTILSTSNASLDAQSKSTKPTTKKARRKLKGKRVLTGPIIPRKPRFKTHQHVQFPKLIETPHYYWPEKGRGQVVLNDDGYHRAVELLLHLEFGTMDQAIASTARWTKEVKMGENWALEIVGKRAITVPASTSSSSETANILSAQTMRKRRPDSHPADNTASSAPSVNTLGGSLVRKKAKLNTGEAADSPALNQDQSHRVAESEPKVNVLTTGLIRKKPKAS